MILEQEKIDYMIKMYFWMSGLIFFSSTLAMILTKGSDFWILITVLISGLILIILIIKYPKKEKETEKGGDEYGRNN